MWRSQLIEKDPDAGKDWEQEEKGMTEGEMVECHHWLNGHEFEQALGDGEGQGSLVCCSPWSHKELDMIEQAETFTFITVPLCLYQEEKNDFVSRNASL